MDNWIESTHFYTMSTFEMNQNCKYWDIAVVFIILILILQTLFYNHYFTIILILKVHRVKTHTIKSKFKSKLTNYYNSGGNPTQEI